MSRSKCQGFEVVDLSGNIDACAKFWFKGYEISCSSIGYSRGNCLNEIMIYDDQDNVVQVIRGTVEEAINWLIQNK